MKNIKPVINVIFISTQKAVMDHHLEGMSTDFKRDRPNNHRRVLLH